MLSFKEPIPQFNNPEDEVAFLKRQLASKEQELASLNFEKPKEVAAIHTIETYKNLPTEVVLHEDSVITPQEEAHITLKLKPESHDRQIEELFGILLEKGLKNALNIVSAMGNPHLEDDFHRFLVQYLIATHEIPGLTSSSGEFKSLHLSLFEITLPVDSISGNGAEKLSPEVLMRAMEQFYAGMQSISVGEFNKQKQYYTIEIAKPLGSEYVVLYVSLPRERASLLEKHLLAYYKDAKVREVTDDYNIFIEGAESVGSHASLQEREVLPILTYDELGHDPMSAILNVFSKLDANQEGAGLQIIVTPINEDKQKNFGTVLDDLKKGIKLKDAGEGTFTQEFFKAGKDFFAKEKTAEEKQKEEEEKKIDDFAIEGVTKKISSSLLSVSVRVVASSSSRNRSESILHDIESAFQQFKKPHGNGFLFTRVAEKKNNQLLHNFIFRIPSEKHSLILNLKELTSIFHFPVGHAATMGIKESRSGTAPAPFEAKEGSVCLGTNEYRGDTSKVFMKEMDRMRHMYVIGQTGTGKTGILLNMIAQDIKNGQGVCYIDPHGNDIQTLLSMIPKERAEDVIYFDPAYIDRPFGLNMLEYDTRYPEQKTFVINELMNIFSQLFDMKSTGGPMFEQYFKNSAGLVMDHPESGSTLLEITRVLSDKAFRDMKLQYTTNPIIKQFWVNAEKTTGEQGLENFVPYITSKFDTFISNEIMRPIVAQQNSSFNFRDIMDKKKILLVNLSKGRLGEINANLIGMIIVGKLQMAALSRVDSFGKDYPPFYLYIDEFQNVTTPSISSILSEARKYKLSLTVAHQYLSQLNEDIKGAILGNVGSMALFRISPEDAMALEGRFKPTFSADDVIKLDNRNALVSMLVNGQPAKPFNLKTEDYMPGNKDIIEPLKQLSYMTYGRPKEEVDQEILERFYKGQKA